MYADPHQHPICLTSEAVPEDRNAAYTRIIDAILGASDLDQISAKKIRTGLQAAVNHDISGEKVCCGF